MHGEILYVQRPVHGRMFLANVSISVTSTTVKAVHGDEPNPRWSSTGIAELVFRRTDDGWKISEFHVKLDRPNPLNNP